MCERIASSRNCVACFDHQIDNFDQKGRCDFWLAQSSGVVAAGRAGQVPT